MQPWQQAWLPHVSSRRQQATVHLWNADQETLVFDTDRRSFVRQVGTSSSGA